MSGNLTQNIHKDLVLTTLFVISDVTVSNPEIDP